MMQSHRSSSHPILHTAYGFILLVCVMVGIIEDINLTVHAFVDHGAGPPGPLAYLMTHLNDWGAILAATVHSINFVMVDALLVSLSLLLPRLYLIYVHSSIVVTSSGRPNLS